jgi:hypothetical protein
VWRKRVEKAARALDVLEKVPEAHVQFTLLRQCLSACKVNDLMRSTPAGWAEVECAQLGSRIRRCLETIMGASPTAVQWEQAALAVRCGGLGVTDPALMRPAARLACIAHFVQNATDVLGLPREMEILPRDLSQVLAAVRAQVGDLQPLPAWQLDQTLLKRVEAPQASQKWWSDKVHCALQASLLTRQPTEADAVRFRCQVRPHALAWLAVVPSVPLRTLIPTVDFAALLQFTLGVPLVGACEDPGGGGRAPIVRRCPKCRLALDDLGHHFVCCQKNQLYRRHNAVVEALAQAASRGGFSYQREQGAGDGSRPGDLFLPRLNADGPAAVDVTVRDPLMPSRPATVERLPTWHSLQEGEKRTQSQTKCARLGWQFIPFVMDVFGGLGEAATELVSTLLKGILARQEAWQRRTVEATVWQSISLSLMKEVARQLAWTVFAEQQGEEEAGSAPSTTHQPYGAGGWGWAYRK